MVISISVFILFISLVFLALYMIYDRKSEGTSTPLRLPVKILAVLAIAAPFLGIVMYSMYGSPFAPEYTGPKAISPQLMTELDGFRKKVMENPEGSNNRCQGLAQLGEVEVRLGLNKQAISDWQEALNEQYNPNLAIMLAELLTTTNGFVSPEAQHLYQQIVDTGNVSPQIKMSAETRLAQAAHEQDRVKEEGFSNEDIQADFK